MCISEIFLDFKNAAQNSLSKKNPSLSTRVFGRIILYAFRQCYRIALRNSKMSNSLSMLK